MQKDTHRMRRRGTIIILALIFVIAPIVLAIFLTSNQSEEIDDHPEHTTPVMVFNNSYQLEDAVGRAISGNLISAISDEVLKETERESAPGPNNNSDFPQNSWIITFVETSFEDTPSQSTNTFSFNITISDGRVYQVYVYNSFIDGFFATIIKRTDIKQDGSIYIYYKDEDNRLKLREWAKDTDSNSTIVHESQVREALGCNRSDTSVPGYVGFNNTPIDSMRADLLQQQLTVAINSMNSTASPGKRIVCVNAIIDDNDSDDLEVQFISTDATATTHIITFSSEPNSISDVTLDGRPI